MSSFRQYGGINYAAKNNIVKNNYANANNLSVMNKVGQFNSDVDFHSNIRIIGSQNGIYFGDGTFQNTKASGGGSGTNYWTLSNSNITNNNSGSVIVSRNLQVLGDSELNNLSARDTSLNKLTTDGETMLNAATQVNNTFNVTGVTTLESNLIVKGLSTNFAGNLSVTSTSSSTSLSGTLDVLGLTTMSNGLQVSTGTNGVNVTISQDDMQLANSTFPSLNSVVTKQYVQNLSLGYQVMAPCACATTGVISLNGLSQLIDNYPVEDGDRVLVWKQSNSVQNGIYDASAGNWSRSPDLPDDAEAKNLFVFVQKGETYNRTTFLQYPAGVIVIVNQADLNFTEYSSIDFSLGNNLELVSGNTLNVKKSLTQINSIQFSTSAIPGTQIDPFMETDVTPV
jgi:hypothetical protein